MDEHEHEHEHICKHASACGMSALHLKFPISFFPSPFFSYLDLCAAPRRVLACTYMYVH